MMRSGQIEQLFCGKSQLDLKEQGLWEKGEVIYKWDSTNEFLRVMEYLDCGGA